MNTAEDGLRHRLQELLDEARTNEKKFQRFDRFERGLIAARSLPELIHAILHSPGSVLETEAVTLVLADPEFEITRILEDGGRGSAETPGLVILPRLFRDNLQPCLGPFDAEMAGAIFDPWPSECQSMALLPLIRQGELIGSLNLGSSQPERFASNRGTFFLERLAAILAICLENGLNLERLKLAGLTDHLTKVHNRRYFDARCHEEAAHARRHGQPLACMLLDIDRFKRINDTLGHLAGDEVLREVAHLIRLQLRGSDIVARYGGEEFVVLMPRTALDRAHEIAERMRAAVAAEALHPLPGESLTVTLSIGVAVLAHPAETDDAAVQQMLGSADAALYQAKESGRNRVMCAG